MSWARPKPDYTLNFKKSNEYTRLAPHLDALENKKTELSKDTGSIAKRKYPIISKLIGQIDELIYNQHDRTKASNQKKDLERKLNLVNDILKCIEPLLDKNSSQFTALNEERNSNKAETNDAVCKGAVAAAVVASLVTPPLVSVVLIGGAAVGAPFLAPTILGDNSATINILIEFKTALEALRGELNAKNKNLLSASIDTPTENSENNYGFHLVQ